MFHCLVPQVVVQVVAALCLGGPGVLQVLGDFVLVVIQVVAALLGGRWLPPLMLLWRQVLPLPV